MKKKPPRMNKIRTRLLSVIFTMLLSTFSLIWIIFNLAARQYVHNSAVSQIESAYNNMQSPIVQMGSFRPMQPFGGRPEYIVRRNLLRIEANNFFIDKDFNLLEGQILSEETPEIIHVLKYRNPDLSNFRQYRQIATTSGVYFVSVFGVAAPRANEEIYWVIYSDITALSNFMGTINIFLIVLVCTMFVAAVFVSFFLSNSITGPIQKLCTLATNIGHGNFTPNDYGFTDIEFAELNAALNKSARQLDVYDGEQKTFFQNVSHELRTPLMSIQCYAEGISFGVMEPEKASETILAETARLNEMVKDLLYISKIDNITTTYTTAKADLIETMRNCAKRYEAVADKKQVRFVYDFDEQPVYCECVSELISRAVENIISNAIRYAVSEIVLSCHKNAGNVEICVTDDGKGIDAEALPHVFERFFKGVDGNHGIGLAIVKSIVEQHEGSVRAENADGSNADNGGARAGGAKFTITLPGEKKTY